MTSVEQVTDPCTYHGEGAVWSPSWGGLRFVDMLAGDILTLQDDGSVTRQHVADVAACVRPRSAGGMVVATERGFVLFDVDGTRHKPADLWTDPAVRMNEGNCDPDGRFYCGSMAYDQTAGAGSLYRLDPDGSVSIVLSGLTLSNGLGFTVDGLNAYYVDSATQEISVFDYDRARGLTARRTLVRISEVLGSPDGITVDAEDHVWVALYRGGAVHRYTPSGKLDEVIDVPARLVTSCALGGPGLDELYVTTSREGLGDDAERFAGSLYRAHIGIAGQLPLPFAG